MTASPGGVSASGGARSLRGPKVLVFGTSAAAFEASAPLLGVVEAAQERISVAFCAPANLLPWLAQRFRGVPAITPPPGIPLAMQRFVLGTNIRLLVVLDDAEAPLELLSAVRREGRALVSLRARPGAPRPRRAVREAAELALDLAETGLDGAAASFELLMKRDWKMRRVRSPFGLPNLVLAAIRNAAGKRLARGLIHAIETPEELDDELGEPRTIMCLGNGPSSEDPRLDAMPYDALFRVNRSWQKRGRFTKPDVVFTGMSRTMKTVDGAIFGLETADSERRLVKRRLLIKRVAGTRFFRVSAMNDALAAFPWDEARPSNGAMMIATAVALKPESLVVAGIDLFRHPAGAYPGDSTTPNAYTPAHNADIELAFLLQLLATYEGELVIIGDALGEAWRDRRAGELNRP